MTGQPRFKQLLAPALVTVVVVVVAALVLARVAIVNSRESSKSGQPHWTAPTPTRLAFEEGLDSLVSSLQTLSQALQVGPVADAQGAFRQARRDYKRIEALLTYYAPPMMAAKLNGPPPEEEQGEPAGPLGAPVGFGVIEAALFSGKGTAALRDSAVASEAQSMLALMQELRSLTGLLVMEEAGALESARIELARIATLGLAGFDASASGNALTESADAIDGLRTMLSVGSLATSPARHEIDTRLTLASQELRAHPAFDTFDRFSFITEHIVPIARTILIARDAIGHDSTTRQFWRSDAATVFDRDAFDPYDFAPRIASPATPELAALGKALFHDARLSGTGTRACSSCHVPARAFSDGRTLAEALPGVHSQVPRNTPTLLNAAFQPRFFVDQRVVSIEEQVGAVLESSSEMNSSAVLAAERLRNDAAYRVSFARAFAGSADSAIGEHSIRVAIAAYIRTLTAMNSRFDQALRGDSARLSDEERLGFNVFMGKGRCGTCHFAPIFNGTMPPDFAMSEPEIIGVPGATAERRTDGDVGRFGVDSQEVHRFAFRVPTIRNVELTAPYMHNGVFKTLEQVVDFYNRGGGVGLGQRLPNQTLLSRPLNLSVKEQRALIAFMKALTDTVVN